MSITFPIFVLEKDSGDMGRFDSIEQTQRHLERIDVANAEYAAWDNAGVPLDLTVQEPLWLAVRPAGNVSDNHLRSALLSLAEHLGVTLNDEERATLKYDQLFDRLATARGALVRVEGFLGRQTRSSRAPS